MTAREDWCTDAYFLVCLQSGEAMQLDCQCRGELAMRHRICAEKWSRVKVVRRLTHLYCIPMTTRPSVPLLAVVGSTT